MARDDSVRGCLHTSSMAIRARPYSTAPRCISSAPHAKVEDRTCLRFPSGHQGRPPLGHPRLLPSLRVADQGHRQCTTGIGIR